VAEAVPDDVRRFIERHVDSASLLEALLLLRRDPDRWWPADDVAAALKTRAAAAEGYLRALRDHALVEEDDGRFRYAVPAVERRTVDALADCFARRRHTVIGVIFDQPDDADTSAARSLADAFRLRRRSD